jgi:hypothetical protein
MVFGLKPTFSQRTHWHTPPRGPPLGTALAQYGKSIGAVPHQSDHRELQPDEVFPSNNTFIYFSFPPARRFPGATSTHVTVPRFKFGRGGAP